MTSITFTLQDSPISDKEAEALIRFATQSDSFNIELSRLIKITKLNPKKLFEISIKENDADLAKLAWRLSTREPVEKESSATQRKNIGPVIAPENRTMDNIVKALVSSNTMWAAGTTMIMWAIYDPENIPYNQEHTLTIKQICTLFLNKVLNSGLSISPDSSVTKGFKKDPDGLWRPDTDNEDPNNRYHRSPLYVAGRTGIIWARENGLVDVEKLVSHGTTKENASPAAKKTQRKYFSIKGNEFGEDTYDAWDAWFDRTAMYLI